MKNINKLIAVLVAILSQTSLQVWAGETGYPEMIEGDTRQVRGPNSPKWLEAVGRLETTLRSGDKEACSVTLLTGYPKGDAILGATALHCVDHWSDGTTQYKAGENSVTFISNAGETIVREIRYVEGKHTVFFADIVFVVLDKPIPMSKLEALQIAPGPYNFLTDDEDFDSDFKTFGTLAGYSADTGLGQYGKVLTYDKCTSLNGGGWGFIKVYCHSYRGASGGPLVITVDTDVEWREPLDSWTRRGYGSGIMHFFVGTIVGGRLADDESKTMVITLSHYYTPKGEQDTERYLIEDVKGYLKKYERQ